MSLPSHMQVLARSTRTTGPNRPSIALDLVERPVPVPGKGEVLVEMEAAGCNPSDVAALSGFYAVSQAAGDICGFEGCGRVVAAGPGMMGRLLKGRRVACATQAKNGLWAEYAAIQARNCAPVGDDLATEAAATFLVNPVTSWAFAEMTQRAGARSIVLSAGASQVARGLLALCRKRDVDVVLIVRRQTQIAEMRSAGAAEVLDQTADDFVEQLRDVCARLRPMLFFDAVGEDLTAVVMAALPDHAETVVYGALDTSGRGTAQAPVPSLIFRGPRVGGFWLPTYFASLSLPKTLRIASDIRRLFTDGTLSTRVAGTYSLADFPAALDAYAADMSAGKRFAVMRR